MKFRNGKLANLSALKKPTYHFSVKCGKTFLAAGR